MRTFGGLIPGLLLGVVFAQSPEPRVELSPEVALLGETTRIPVVLKSAGVQISTMEHKVTFPGILSFTEVVLSEAAASSALEVRFEVLPSSETPDENTVVVHIDAPQGEVLPDSNIAFLVFTVPEELDSEEESVEIRLPNQTAFVTRDEERIEVEGVAGSLTLMAAPPAIACFFFMH